MIIFQDSVTAYTSTVSHLLYLHWDEVAKNKSLMQLRPDWQRYMQLEQAGKLFVLYAFDGDKLIGYSCNVIDYHLHYSALKVSSNDVLFVHPDHRGTCGLRLIAETERMAKDYGAELMLWHAKQDSQLDKLLRRKHERYAVQDVIYSTPL